MFQHNFTVVSVLLRRLHCKVAIHRVAFPFPYPLCNYCLNWALSEALPGAVGNCVFGENAIRSGNTNIIISLVGLLWISVIDKGYETQLKPLKKGHIEYFKCTVRPWLNILYIVMNVAMNPCHFISVDPNCIHSVSYPSGPGTILHCTVALRMACWQMDQVYWSSSVTYLPPPQKGQKHVGYRKARFMSRWPCHVVEWSPLRVKEGWFQ